jgi:diguanylate cyclase (GGDEF)-like protein/putative nucleotidyltransferase with HDIG domain
VVKKQHQEPIELRTKENSVTSTPITSRLASNPIIREATNIVARINDFNSHKTSNRLYAGYLNNTAHSDKAVDYTEVIRSLNQIAQKNDSVQDLTAAMHNLFTRHLNSSFTAFGLYHESSKCINLKLQNITGSTFSSKIFLSDETSPLVECFVTGTPVIKENNKFLSIPYLQNSQALILPLRTINKCTGILILGRENAEADIALLSFIANYCALYIENIKLLGKTNKYANTDNLTGMYNHRGFQEILSGELEKAQENKTNLSIIMMDINNISKINRELGHAKGDEVIKLVADNIKQNNRTGDSIGRYGGDEIAMILPDTGTADAKYLAEYITYCLSCCFVDDVGPVKVAVGIATYPECSKDQEKLLILSEQAMYVSQAKGYKEGMSAIVSSTDYNFWDDEALNSFAQVISKRHSQLGINYEEELVHKFNNEQIISQNHLVEMVTSLAGAIDAKDPYTKGHSTSVSRYSEALARAVNLPEDEVKRITLGALLHDVGKIGIPEDVLRKPDKLSDEEWEIMKQHPTIGAEKVLEPNEALRDLIPIVKHHHEHIDGTGYPDKLKGEEIPLSARIVSVADAYHALISDRPYRKGMPVEKACEILRTGAGTYWDADLVRHFINIAPSLSTTV